MPEANPTDPSAPKTIEELVAAFRDALGDRLRAIYRYGAPLHRPEEPTSDGEADATERGARRLLILVDRVDLKALRRSGKTAVAARKLGFKVRLDTSPDILGSSDTHPVFALSLLDTKELLHGDDLLANLTIRPEHLRIHVEQALRTLFHELTDGFLHAPRNEERVTRLLRQCGRRLVYLLEGLLILRGELDPPTGTVAPPRAVDAIIAAAAPVVDEAGRELTARLWELADREESLAGDELYATFGGTIDLLRALIVVADTHRD